MLCAVCDKLNVTDLIHLAQANAGVEEEHRRKWIHHSTYNDVVVAARNGCELCKVLVASLDRRVRRPPWELTYKDVLLEDERRGLSSGLNVVLRGERREDLKDEISFVFGEKGDVPLVFELQTPKGRGWVYYVMMFDWIINSSIL